MFLKQNALFKVPNMSLCETDEFTNKLPWLYMTQTYNSGKKMRFFMTKIPEKKKIFLQSSDATQSICRPKYTKNYLQTAKYLSVARPIVR